MSSDWINLFVHQGREFVESISRRDKEGSPTLLDKSDESIVKHDNVIDMEEDVGVLNLSMNESKTDEKLGEGTSKDDKDMPTKAVTGAAKDIYEVQLEQLQEQLVDIMIQNQEMVAELNSLRQSDAVKLSKELEKEQSKRRHLEEKLRKIKEEDETPKLRRRRRKGEKSKSLLDNDSEKDTNEKMDKTEIAETNDNTENMLGSEDIQASDGEKASRLKRVKSWVYSWYKSLSDWATVMVWNIVSDMTDEETPSDVGDADGAPLSVKLLKENINRFGCGFRPLTEFSKKVDWVLSWKNPAATMLVFLAYLLSFWYGYSVPLVIFLAIVQLSANFVYSKFGSTSVKDDVESPVENSQSWTDRFQVVLHVARKVQNILGSLSDYLEKIKNLLMWKVPHITMKLYICLWIILITSLALDGPCFFTILGMLLGYKLFIKDPLYRRFPKLKKRHDTTWRLWTELPVDSETLVDGRTNELEESQVSISYQGPMPSSSSVPEVPTLHSKLFCERYKLTSDEVLVKGWEEGWRTSLLNKLSPLIHMKHGRLYLTQNYLCFERSNNWYATHTARMEKNILIRLSDIRYVNKYKPLYILPGTGMSIEVCIKEKVEPYIFGAIYGRDEAFSDLIKTGKEAGLPWAT